MHWLHLEPTRLVLPLTVQLGAVVEAEEAEEEAAKEAAGEAVARIEWWIAPITATLLSSKSLAWVTCDSDPPALQVAEVVTAKLVLKCSSRCQK
jgi:hypothetical protein